MVNEKQYFCYVQTLKGVSPVIIYGDLTINKDSYNRDKQKLLLLIELDPSLYGMGLDKLSALYPYQQEKTK